MHGNDLGQHKATAPFIVPAPEGAPLEAADRRSVFVEPIRALPTARVEQRINAVRRHNLRSPPTVPEEVCMHPPLALTLN